VFSKFGVAVPLRSKETHVVAKAIVNHIFLKCGLCHEILTDQGSEVEAELLEELIRLLGITRLRTLRYRPQTNGACEVWYRTLLSVSQRLSLKTRRIGQSGLIISHSVRVLRHTRQQVLPFFVFTGHVSLWNIDLLLPEVDHKFISS